MRNWWPFPPRTREIQFDEKWSFVRCKQDRCDLENQGDHRRGDCWDHVALDAEHRLVLGVEVGKRSATAILRLMKKVRIQLQGRVPRLLTSDEFQSYQTVIRLVWPARQPTYATACKTREDGHVTTVTSRVVFGSEASLARALRRSKASHAVNTAFLERHNGTDRHRNARKARRTYRFSKDWDVHRAVTCFTCYVYNFCWAVRTLRKAARQKHANRKWTAQSPAMAAQLTDHLWTLAEWLARPVIGLSNQ